MKRIYVLLSFMALISARAETRDVGITKNLTVNLNKIVDYSNPQITQFIIKRRLDPLNLPYTEKKLWMVCNNFGEAVFIARTDQIPSMDSVKPMLYKADLVLHSGILKHLSILQRYGDATLIYENKIVKINVAFAFKFLQATYEYILKMGLFDCDGRVMATTEDAHVKISVIFNTTDYILILDKFEIRTSGRIKVMVENKNGKMDWIKTAIINIIIPFFQNTITSNIQIKAADAIRMYFNEINRIIAPPKKIPRVFTASIIKRHMNER